MNTLRVFLAGLLFPTFALSQTVGPPIRLDTSGCIQPRGTYDSASRFVVVYAGWWASNKGIYGKRFDTSMHLIGTEFTVFAGGECRGGPAVGCFDDGGFVVAWEQWDPEWMSHKAVVRRFDSDAVPESPVVDVPSSMGDGVPICGVLPAPDGSFEVLWFIGDVGSGATWSCVFDAATTPGSHRISMMGSFPQKGQVATDGSGNTVGVQTARYGDVRRLQRSLGDIENGFTYDSRKLLDTTLTEYWRLDAYDVAMNTLGQFVITWEDESGIWCQRFDALGDAVGSRLNVTTVAYALGVALLDSGDYLVAWRSTDASVGVIRARHVDHNNVMGGELEISDYMELGSVAASPDGRFAVTYYNNSPVSWVRQVQLQTTPVTFSAVTADYERGAVILSWDLFADEAVEAIRVSRSDRGDPVAALDGNARGYADTGVEPGRDYVYTITAVRLDGGEVESRPVRVSVPGTSFELAQNEPNPFNPSTTIRYSLDEVSDVSIDIYNAAGQRVRSFDEGILPAGWHSVTWDGRDAAGNEVASGVYLYVLNAGKKRVSKKMSLLK